MPAKLTKADLSKELARVCASSRKDGGRFLEIILDAIVRALSRHERVEIRGFGSFGTRVRKARAGTNPSTGATIAVPAKRMPYFKPAKELRNLLNARLEMRD